ncbi:DEAD/DEAH box helicase [Flavobacterium sp. SH_e]|uniref:DEAD/DEAH box helicase n=1 Tax=Flavobacterium sp. SH_e TaxID=2983767 RepID=UPI0021E49B75|nr:DEAD/DEAH box helicase [Flavobacterium sp. SH_e]MCV2486505.1 DEAD/DEAH box helicase [Flavobacterium sp. SH_e]
MDKTDDLKQLKKLGNDEYFKEAFQKLCLNKQLSDIEEEYLLTCALLFFKNYNLDKRLKVYFKIGYYIILKYSINSKNYKPLYEISLQIGFYPLIDFITDQNRNLYKVNSKNLILDAITFISYRKDFKSPENYIESLEQNISRNSIINSDSEEIAYIAPTSYGKSSIIKEFIKLNNYSRIAIIVPSKSLLVQTYKEIKSLKLDYKLVLHDEMFNVNDQKFIGILTQERATRILNKYKLSNFEILFIDEAHKLFDRDSRSYILSRLMQLNYIRNNKQKVVYLSPLIENDQNLKVKNSNTGLIYTKRIQHDFKSFELYLFKDNQSYFYDRFTDSYFTINGKINYFKYIESNSSNKNFIFNSRPVKVESLAENISKNVYTNLSGNKEIDIIVETLTKEVHKSFYAVDYIKKGVVYIHAKIPNIIKEYLEDKFKTVAEIRYIVANSVILEGINLPIETIFITTNGTGNKIERLKVKDLINLIGRANRLNDVFKKDKQNLSGLVSKIHFLDHEYYQGKLSIKSAIKSLREDSFKDTIKNPLIQNYNIDDLSFSGNKQEKLERKIKHSIIDQEILKYSEFVLEDPTNLDFEIKKNFIENSINMIFHDLDKAINTVIQNISSYNFAVSDKIVDIVFKIFIENNENNISDFVVERLRNEKARNYYNNYLEVMQKMHLNERITNTLKYFKQKAKSEDSSLYIGESYGDMISPYKTYNNKHYNGKVYIDLNISEDKLVNIAIVKLKMEEDFISFKLNSLIVFLYEFEIIPEDYYFNYIYGTNDMEVIKLARFGLSVNIITKLQSDNQIENIEIDNNGNLRVKNIRDFNNYLQKQQELFRFEIQRYLN